MMEGNSIRPIPDPTELTMQQLLREQMQLREILEAKIDGMMALVERLQADGLRVPAEIDFRLNQFHQLTLEKFRSIQLQFTERDVRTEQTARDSKVAVDAALQAAKEALAVAKSEMATMKQIDQLGLMMGALQKVFDDKIDNLKYLLDRSEGKELGYRASAEFHRSSLGISIAAVNVLLIGLSLIITLFLDMKGT
jgi:hypothetical protein